MKNLFVQFYTHYKHQSKYDLFNGFSDTWDLCKSKGDMIWISWDWQDENIPELNLPFSKGTVYISCFFENHVDAAYKWSEEYPSVDFVIGGPGVIFNEIQSRDNIEYFRCTVEEYFGVNNFSYEWKLEIPQEIENVNMDILRYNYGIKATCYWNKCSYCRLSLVESKRVRPLHNFKNSFKKISRAKEEIIIFYNPSITPDMFKDFLVPLELDESMKIRIYTRPDKKTYMACKTFFPLIKSLHKINFSIAPEFLSQRMLDFMNKGTTIETVTDIIKLYNEYDVEYEVNFIVGWPNLTENDLVHMQNNMSMFTKDILINLFLLKISSEGMGFSSIFPPPDGKRWSPIDECSEETISLNIKLQQLIHDKFNRVKYNNFNKDYLEKLLYIKREYDKHATG